MKLKKIKSCSSIVSPIFLQWFIIGRPRNQTVPRSPSRPSHCPVVPIGPEIDPTREWDPRQPHNRVHSLCTTIQQLPSCNSSILRLRMQLGFSFQHLQHGVLLLPILVRDSRHGSNPSRLTGRGRGRSRLHLGVRFVREQSL